MRSAEEAIQVVGETAPDVILVKLPSELDAAAEIARRLRRETPNVALILMGGEDDDASIVEALEVGATAHVGEMAEPASSLRPSAVWPWAMTRSRRRSLAAQT